MANLSAIVRKAVFGAEANKDSVYNLSVSIARSGYSFGRAQGDLSSGNELANKYFNNILENTTEITGFDRSTINNIESAVKSKGKSQIVEDYKDQLNQALSSEYGQAAINMFDTKQISADVNQVQAVIDAASENPNGLGVFQPGAQGNVIALAEVAEYVNQFGTTPILEDYLSGQEATFKTKDPIAIEGAVTLQNLERFFAYTDYFSQNSDLFKRFKNIARSVATVGSEIDIDLDDEGLSPKGSTFQTAGPTQTINLSEGVTLSGGVLTGHTSSTPADQGIIYVTGAYDDSINIEPDPSLQNPISLDFKDLVDKISISVLNGRPEPQSYRLVDGHGDSTSMTIPGNQDSGSSVLTLNAAGGARHFQLYSDYEPWDFAINHLNAHKINL